MHQEYQFQHIERQISSLLNSCCKDLGITDTPVIVVEIPKERSCGNLSTNIALRIASILKKNPKDISAQISSLCSEKLTEYKLDSVIGKVESAPPGFVNFYIKNSFLQGMATDIVRNKSKFGEFDFGEKKKVQIEFVSANPTGPLSIAHARQAVVGDSLARILESLGYKVSREYYNNDEGNQINILGRSLELRYKELLGEAIDFPEECYQGEYIFDLARQIKDKKIKVKSEGDFRNFALKQMTETIKGELKDFGVKFDLWYSQKDNMTAKVVTKSLDYLRKEGHIYDQDGAVWFKSTAFGDDKDRVVVKSDGNYTYLAPDIAYHNDKFRRGFEWLINIWGPDHHGYIPRINAAVQALGHDKDSLDVIIVQLATIYREGKAISMSTRKGQYITLREVLNEVGRDASRFFLLMRRTNSHLDFDLELAKKQTSENPVYYVQYAHARICSILNNADVKLNLGECDTTLLKEKEEADLLELIFQFPYVLRVCLKQLDPFHVTGYLQSIASSFHKFYDKHRVLGVEPDLVQARLALIEAVRIVFAKGLDLLGISKPEKM
ncbi:arginine--tRNA ligase [Thermoproteota archaeon]